ncbi:LEAF RUST 10 DISEASE-RESISTANCE LOCUS RECEPTOR-LIKE PROTEIN KINASE-like 2.1 isoform X2 [Vigna radiata var. radiata]|uniref:non-specific serine/threonine protein kinase n=1 Tax=Vigna radiata var. radiata TaxID=3916 RepID=A0A3Q0FCD7_VIGRR|nr:LEAF RUST 10 DISEASE-RESISTANCE LOCUS RECEPTOR-LIKE PROTEIN KINASE-like 2.1 isoform X2 [Vigna radiata var. radiata]
MFSVFNHLHPQLQRKPSKMINPNTQFFILKPFCFPIIIFFLLAQITSSQVDPKFVACAPKTCPNNNQSISFPFYIRGTQEPYCGSPGFEISCSPDGFPILNLSHTQYLVHHIFYQSQSLRVSNAAFSTLQSNTTRGCLVPTQNLTLPPTNVFRVGPNQRDMVLFYGCDAPSLHEHRVGCSAENETSYVLALDKRDENISVVGENCKGEVVDTVVEDGIGGVAEALSKGFLLSWTASNCSVCNSTGGRCGFDSDMYAFRCYCTDRVHSAKCGADDPALAVGVVGVVVVVVLACWFRTKIFPSSLLFRRDNPTHHVIQKILKEHGPLPITRHNYSEIKKMTNSFKNKLGQGGFGTVYKGKLHDGRVVAVKILAESKGNGEDFINEVASISTTSHVNVVRLLGFCFDGSKRALIYEFMTNGSLDKFIYQDKNPLQVTHQLDCQIMYNIAIGIARGLEYLHRGCNTRILHFDIKPHNILLDENFSPKISDFGLAKICPTRESAVSITGARGTAGYIAPEVFCRNFGAVSHKSDVYSYGMMILEMVGGRKNIKVEVDRSSELYFPHWIYDRLESNQELDLQIVRNEGDDKMMRKMAVVGLWCIQTHPSSRPTISSVVEMLEKKVELLELPPKPFLSSPSPSPLHLSQDTL